MSLVPTLSEAADRCLHGNRSAAVDLLTQSLQASKEDPIQQSQLYRARCEVFRMMGLTKKALKDAEAAFAADPCAASILLRVRCLVASAGKKITHDVKNALEVSLSSPHATNFELSDWMWLLEHARQDTERTKDDETESESVASCSSSSVSSSSSASSTIPALILQRVGEFTPHAKSMLAQIQGAFHGGNDAAREILIDTLRKKEESGEKLIGHPEIDCLVATGNLFVNNGLVVDAIGVFQDILSKYPSCPPAFAGLGTAFALKKNLEKALLSFSAGLEIDPQNVECLSRRAQVFQSLGQVDRAIQDLVRAREIDSTNLYVLESLGTLYAQEKRYESAIDCLRSLPPNAKNSSTMLRLVKLLVSSGNISDAESFVQNMVMQSEPSADMHISLASVAKERGLFEEVVQHYHSAIKISPNHPVAWTALAVILHGTGHYRSAIAATEKFFSLNRNSSAIDHLYVRAMSLNALGEFEKAKDAYIDCYKTGDQVAKVGLVQLAILEKMLTALEKSRLEINLDTFLEEDLRSSFSHRRVSSTIQRRLPELSSLSCPDPLDGAVGSLSDEEVDLIAFADDLGKILLQKCSGFIRNIRQIRSAGLAITDMAYEIRRYWMRSSPLQSSFCYGRARSRISSNPELMNWRDMIDIGMFWRQISEPFDPVYWIDCLPQEDFARGFGLHTPILSGESHPPKYFRFAPRALDLLRAHIHDARNDFGNIPLSEETISACRSSSSLSEIHAHIGMDFFVIVPCHSVCCPGRIIEGTRLTVQRQSDGMHLAIRTPGLPIRFEHMDEELSSLWNEIDMHVQDTYEGHPYKHCERIREDEVLFRLVLKFYYFFVVGQMTTRGTAALGLYALTAFFLAAGIKLENFTVDSTLFDFESILTENVNDFIDRVESIIGPHRTIPVADPLDRFSYALGDSETLTRDCAPFAPTLRDALHLLVVDLNGEDDPVHLIP